MSAPSSFSTLAVSMHEVYCVGYTHRAWDPRFLDVPLYFGPFQRLRSGERPLSLVYNNNNNILRLNYMNKKNFYSVVIINLFVI